MSYFDAYDEFIQRVRLGSGVAHYNCCVGCVPLSRGRRIHRHHSENANSDKTINYFTVRYTVFPTTRRLTSDHRQRQSFDVHAVVRVGTQQFLKFNVQPTRVGGEVNEQKKRSLSLK